MFVKFPSIDRFDLLSEEQLEKFRIAKMVNVTEKIDGSHLTIWIPYDKTQSIEIYSRNGNTFSQGDFNVICRDKLIADCEKLRIDNDEFRSHGLVDDQIGLILDGEAYGRRIMNRLPYQDECKVLIYRGTTVCQDESKNEVWTKGRLNGILRDLNLGEYVLNPIKNMLFSEGNIDLEKLMKGLPLPFNSSFTITESKAEGYVLDFYDYGEDDYVWIGSLKYKDEGFNDMKAKSSITPEDYNYALNIQKEFAEYVLNENRILDAYGKGYKKLSELIPEVLSDAKKDFLKNQDKTMIEILENNKQLNKVAFNLGSKLFVMAKQVLNKHFGLEY